jgi:hypothetical protein
MPAGSHRISHGGCEPAHARLVEVRKRLIFLAVLQSRRDSFKTWKMQVKRFISCEDFAVDLDRRIGGLVATRAPSS